MSKEAVVVEEVEAVSAPAVTGEERFPLTHKGFGKFEVNGVTHASKEAAVAYRAKLLEQTKWEEDYGDIIPEGIDIRITDRSLVFRGSILEVPMNEVYLPTGDFNPTYDRAWYYAWAARRGSIISSYEALGYKRFLYTELEAMVKEGTAPAHYLSLLQRDGDSLVYDDLILMRTPRALWRQRKAEEAKQVDAKSQKNWAEGGRPENFGPFKGEAIELSL